MPSETRYLTQAELAREALLPIDDARRLLSQADWDDAGTADLKGLSEPVGLARLR